MKVKARANNLKKNIEIDASFIEDHSVEEVEAVLAHEVGHIALEHFLRQSKRSKLPTLTTLIWMIKNSCLVLLFYLGCFVSNELQLTNINYEIFWLGIALFLVFTISLSVDLNGRDSEFQADLVASLLLDNPQRILRTWKLLFPQYYKDLTLLDHLVLNTISKKYVHRQRIEHLQQLSTVKK